MEVIDDDEHSVTEHDDSLPFALSPETPSEQRNLCVGAAYVPSAYPATASFLSSSSSHPPQLASSVLSSPTSEGESLMSSPTDFGSNSLFHPNSQYLDVAASLLLPCSSFLGGLSSTTITERIHENQHVEIEHENSKQGDSVDFSQLLLAADDRQPVSRIKERLPVLPEEASVASGESVHATEHLVSPRPSGQASAEWFGRWNGVFAAGQQTIIPASSETSSSSFLYRSQERRMASLAGATAVMTGHNTFTVAVDIVAPGVSVRDVMDIVGNPDLLHLWSDPIRALVITRSSEGARNAINMRGSSGQSHREYEGEWIEATTSQLIEPTSAISVSCIYATGHSLAAALGFPSYGKISMFVERKRGQVGLTVGPFAGGYELFSKIRVHEVTLNTSEHSRVRITNECKLQREGDQGVRFCGFLNVFEKCFLPTIEDYMDQSLSSVARLRFLVENGEHSVYMDTSMLMDEYNPSSPLLP